MRDKLVRNYKIDHEKTIKILIEGLSLNTYLEIQKYLNNGING